MEKINEIIDVLKETIDNLEKIRANEEQEAGRYRRLNERLDKIETKLKEIDLKI